MSIIPVIPVKNPHYILCKRQYSGGNWFPYRETRPRASLKVRAPKCWHPLY